MSIDYLQQLLKESNGAQSRNSKRKFNINAMLTQPDVPVVAPGAAAPSVAPTKSSSMKPHSMGDGDGHKSQSEVNGLNAQFNSNLQRLIKDAPGAITIGSGYRSIAEQQVLYDRYKRGVKGQAPAAKPGNSDHNFGLAADLKYANAATGEWARANATRYGLQFPMSYEPWHVSAINAKAMRGK